LLPDSHSLQLPRTELEGECWSYRAHVRRARPEPERVTPVSAQDAHRLVPWQAQRHQAQLYELRRTLLCSPLVCSGLVQSRQTRTFCCSQACLDSVSHRISTQTSPGWLPAPQPDGFEILSLAERSGSSVRHRGHKPCPLRRHRLKPSRLRRFSSRISWRGSTRAAGMAGCDPGRYGARGAPPRVYRVPVGQCTRSERTLRAFCPRGE